jgi:hypothetical protein
LLAYFLYFSKVIPKNLPGVCSDPTSLCPGTRQCRSEPATQSAVVAASGVTSSCARGNGLDSRPEPQKQSINVWKVIRSLRWSCAMSRRNSPQIRTAAQVQANLQERARATIEARPDPRAQLRRFDRLRPRNRLKAAGFKHRRASRRSAFCLIQMNYLLKTGSSGRARPGNQRCHISAPFPAELAREPRLRGSP